MSSPRTNDSGEPPMKVQKTMEGSNSFVLPKVNNYTPAEGPVVLMVLDGFGIAGPCDHNCVHLAEAHNSTYEAWKKTAQENNLYAEIKAHGTAVGLPDDGDMGNSEVGHNALGCGQIVDQGAKLVNRCISEGTMFTSANWKVIESKSAAGKTVHFMILLSDGGVHSNINQLEKILEACVASGIKKVRVHPVTDGRDVAPRSSEKFVPQLEAMLAKGTAAGLDYKVGSGGGRMYCMMDRYGSDWNIVKRSYDAMVHGTIDASIVPEISEAYTGRFQSMEAWRQAVFELFPNKDDQFFPPFVVVDSNDVPVGRVEEGDAVINLNYRGDRAIQISQAFENADFDSFDRGVAPKVDYFGMLIYDADRGIPSQALAPNPDISNVMGEYMVANGVTSYACAETHKYGHVTYFWNGNRSGYINESMELYEEVLSQPATPEQLTIRPEMECVGITNNILAQIEAGKYKYLRLNYANGDMCGHTGYIPPTTQSVVAMYEQMKRIVDAVEAKNGVVIITADHGNCEEMKDKKGGALTSHTLNLVPFLVIDKNAKGQYTVNTDGVDTPGLSNVAASVINIMGFEKPSMYRDSLIKFA